MACVFARRTSRQHDSSARPRVHSPFIAIFCEFLDLRPRRAWITEFSPWGRVCAISLTDLLERTRRTDPLRRSITFLSFDRPSGYWRVAHPFGFSFPYRNLGAPSLRFVQGRVPLLLVALGFHARWTAPHLRRSSPALYHLFLLSPDA